MRGITNRWVRRNEHESWLAPQAATAESPLLDRILAARGLTDPAQVAVFHQPSLQQLHPPEALPGVDQAARRLLDGLQRGEAIAIYGDYDVDGITATAILYHTLKQIDSQAKITTFVPHRLEDGYGLNADAIRELYAGGTRVIVSVDCGITARAEAEVARELGVDLIITDHHNLPARASDLPRAFALVHPCLPGSDYPFRDLCGAGVAFKLAWRLATMACGSERVGEEMRDHLLRLLPLAALGTIADVAPLIDENRIITSFGLRLLHKAGLPGLDALIEATGLAERKIDTSRVGFILAPHLNACGRMGHAREAVELLTTAHGQRANEIADQLATTNRERQRTQRAMQTQAARLAEDRGMTADDRRIIILADPGWHPGVVGIVCSRLTEMFSRPAVLMQENGGVCRGSARSIDGYSIAAAFEACSDLLTSHGGHDMAAGLSLPTTSIAAFTEQLTKHANHHINPEQLTPKLTIDCDGRLAELTNDSVGAVERMEPFGRGNPRPVIRLTNLRVARPPRQMGSEGKHLDLQFDDEGISGGPRRHLRAVWWNRGDLAGDFATGQRLDLAIQPKINTWNGRSNVEGDIRDLHICPPDRGTITGQSLVGEGIGRPGSKPATIGMKPG